jgi:hypothetical protein
VLIEGSRTLHSEWSASSRIRASAAKASRSDPGREVGADEEAANRHRDPRREARRGVRQPLFGEGCNRPVARSRPVTHLLARAQPLADLTSKRGRMRFGMDYFPVAHDQTLIELARQTGSSSARSPNGIRTRVATLRERVHLSVHVRQAPDVPCLGAKTLIDVQECPQPSSVLMGILMGKPVSRCRLATNEVRHSWDSEGNGSVLGCIDKSLEDEGCPRGSEAAHRSAEAASDVA